MRPFLLGTEVGRIALIPIRLRTALAACAPQLRQAIGWAFSSHELHNFTYEITRANCEYLAHTVSVVTAVPYSVAMSYIQELQEDEEIRRYVTQRIRQSSARYSADQRCAFGRRLGWYAFVRILKPRVVVETGVDKGLGAVAICAALLRNESEGFAGQYFGTDINPDAGLLLADPYKRVGKILYGDSLLSLQSIQEIDMFINDSDHSAEYERSEYETVAPKMGMGRGLILGDNSHCTDVLAKFSTERGRRFIFFREEPMHHWYRGGGIGISFVGQTRMPAVDSVSSRSPRLAVDAKPERVLATEQQTPTESTGDPR